MTTSTKTTITNPDATQATARPIHSLVLSIQRDSILSTFIFCIQLKLN
jgi:hypothetical protein